MPRRRYNCPKCKLKMGVTILYGMPGIELAEQAERQEIVLGGCVLELDAPERHCISCGNEWQIVHKYEWIPPSER